MCCLQYGEDILPAYGCQYQQVTLTKERQIMDPNLGLIVIAFVLLAFIIGLVALVAIVFGHANIAAQAIDTLKELAQATLRKW